MQDSKEIKIRAFEIENNSLSQNKSNILELLNSCTEHSKLNNRRMPLQESDTSSDEDILSFFCNTFTPDKKHNIRFDGILIRVTEKERIPNITDEMLNKELILISDIENLKKEGASILYKNHYYFSLTNKYLVTNLPYPKKISQLQNYINWLLRDVRGENYYEFTPIVEKDKETQIKDIKSIRFKDSSIPINNSSENGIKTIRNLDKGLLSKIFQTTKDLDDILENNIVSTTLSIKFVRKKGVKKDDYLKSMSAILKPIGEDEDISFVTKNNGVIKPGDLLKTELVTIEVGSNGKISENQLFQKMEIFLNKLKI